MVSRHLSLARVSQLLAPRFLKDNRRSHMVSQDGAHSRLPVSDPPPRYKGGIDGFLEHSEKLANRDVIITHQLVPAVIDVRGTKGYAESNCLIMSRFPHDGHD